MAGLRERLASGRAVRSCDLGIGRGLRMKILAGYGRHEIFEADATEAFSLQVAYGLGRFGQLIETTPGFVRTDFAESMLLLAERGAKLVLGARRADRLEALADRIGKEGGAAVYDRKTSAERIRANSSLVLKPGMRFSPGV